MTAWFCHNRSLIVTSAVIVAVLVLAASNMSPRVLVSVLLSGLTLGALYFMVTAGLSLIFGLMDVLNFAHGVIFMLGAYAGYTLYTSAFLSSLSTDVRFVLALSFGALVGAGLGALMEYGLIRPLYSRPIYQVLLTLGLVFVGDQFVKLVWGPSGFFMEIPSLFNGQGRECPSDNLIAWFSDHCASIMIMGRGFPSYRLFLIALGVAMLIVMGLLLTRTRIGMIIRAGVQDAEMVEALGINVRRVFTGVFALGAGLAALGGVAAAPMIGVNPAIGQEFLLQGFISVVIGGMGSLSGAAIGSLLVGLARAFGDNLVLSGIQLPWMEQALTASPAIARASTVLIMALVLLLKPSGIFGKKE
jgi:branched-chain amino acid transport system permease protein